MIWRTPFHSTIFIIFILVNISHNRFAGGSRDPDLSLLVKILLKWGWNGLTRSTTFFFYCHWKLERYFIMCLYSVLNATKRVSNVKETWHSQNTAPLMVRSHAFRITCKHNNPYPEDIPYPPPVSTRKSYCDINLNENI